MPIEIGELNNRGDTERLSRVIIGSLKGEKPPFNPYEGMVFSCNDGTILFMGRELTLEDAPRCIAEHLWKNRKRVNKQINKWRKVGPDFVNCGC